MHRFTLSLMLACGPAVAFAAEAADHPERHCSALPTAAERIVCYDTQFPPDQSPDTPVESPEPVAKAPLQPASSQSASVSSQSPSASTQSASVASQSPSDPSQSVSVPSASEPSHAPVVSSDSDGGEVWSHGLFAKSARVHEQSTITAIRRRESQSMVFLLANEQIWLQDSQRSLPFRVGDAVTITNGTIGGYFLTSDSGTKTRVRRIK